MRKVELGLLGVAKLVLGDVEGIKSPKSVSDLV